MFDTTHLTQEDKRNLRRLLDALNLFASLQPEHKTKPLPLDMFRVFLTIAMNEGLGTLELAKHSKIVNTTVSRHIMDMGDLDRYQNEGLELVFQKLDVRDKRRHPTFLSPKGRGFLSRLTDLLRGR